MLFQVQIKGDGENAWRVSAKVANTMNCKVTKLDQRNTYLELVKHSISLQNITASVCRMTLLDEKYRRIQNNQKRICQVTKSGEAFSAGPIMGTKMMPVPRLEVYTCLHIEKSCFIVFNAHEMIQLRSVFYFPPRRGRRR